MSEALSKILEQLDRVDDVVEETNKALGLDEASQGDTADANVSAISSKKPNFMLVQSARAVQPQTHTQQLQNFQLKLPQEPARPHEEPKHPVKYFKEQDPD